MALIVEDGSGLATAESFVSVADADTYLANRYGSSITWLSLTDTQKEQYLRTATDYLVGRYRNCWKGLKKTRTQHLPWPRSSVYDEEGYYRASDELPTELVWATAEAAKRLSEGTSLDEDLSRGGSVQSVTVGPISKTFMDGADSETRFTRIERLLSGLISTSGRGLARVTRS